MGEKSPSVKISTPGSFDPEPDSFPRLSLPPKLSLKRKKPRSEQLVKDANHRLAKLTPIISHSAHYRSTIHSVSIPTSCDDNLQMNTHFIQPSNPNLQTEKELQSAEQSSSQLILNPSTQKHSKLPSVRTPKNRDTKRKGLRHFAIRVRNKVEHKGVTTYNEVADELLEEERVAERQDHPHTNFSIDKDLLNNSGPIIDEKNIRRRVYDSLNVLMAMGIIRKDKKLIIWQGLDIAHSTEDRSQVAELKAFLAEKNTIMETERAMLAHIRQQYQQVTEIIERNKVKAIEQGEEDVTKLHSVVPGFEKIPLHHQNLNRLGFPFIIVAANQNAKIELKMDERRENVNFSFDTAFSVLDDREVIRRMNLTSDLQQNITPHETTDDRNLNT